MSCHTSAFCPGCCNRMELSETPATCANCGLRFIDFGVEVWSDKAHLRIPAPVVRQIVGAGVTPDFRSKQLLAYNAEENLWFLTLRRPAQLESKPSVMREESWHEMGGKGRSIPWVAQLTLGKTPSALGRTFGGRVATIPARLQGHVPLGKHCAALIEKAGYVALMFPHG